MPWLFFIVLIDGIGFGIILPLLPIFAVNFHLDAMHLGILTASFSFFQLITSPILGALSDKFGRKIIIVICLFAIALSYFILAHSTSFWQLLFARILAGTFTGNVSVVLASVADLSNEKNRVKYMGIIGAASGIGFMIGPIIGGFLAGDSIIDADFKLVFIVATVFTALAGFLAMLFLKETNHIKANFHSTHQDLYHEINIFKQIKHTLYTMVNNKEMVFLIYLSILMWFAFSSIYVFLSTWTVLKFHLTPFTFGIVGTVFAFFVALIQVLSPKVIQGGKAILIGFQLSAFAMLAMLLNPSLIPLSIIVIAIALGLGILFPNINSSISSYGNQRQRGFILGFSQSAGMLGQTLGPLVIGVVYTYGSPNLAWVGIASSFLLASFITLRYMLANK